MNESASRLIELAWTQSWQVAAVVVTVALATRLRAVRRRPHLAYALWMLVLAKALTPTLWASPTGAFSWALAERTGPAVETTLDKPALNQPAAAPTELAQATADSGRPVVPRHIVPSPNESAEPLSEQPKAIEPAPGSRWNVATVLIVVWFVGGAVYAGLSLGWYWRVRRRLWRQSQEDRPDVAALVFEVARSFGMRRRPQTIVTEYSFGPALIGLWRPALVIPKGIWSQLSREQIRLVMAHELVHLRRGDHWVGLLQFIAQSIWWFNPLVWWANRATNRVREQCCDEEVLASLRCEPGSYAQTLLDIARLGPRTRPLILATGVGAMQVTQQRMEHIMSDASRFHRATPRGYWLAGALLALLVLPGAGLAWEQVTATTTESAQKNNEKQTDDVAASKKDKVSVFTYTGQVVDSETKAPIEGAVVKFRQRRRGSNAEEAVTSEHRSNAQGEFTFSLPVKNESDYLLYHLYADIEHPRYLRRGIWDYQRTAGEPFFKQIAMYRSTQLRGSVATPAGDPGKNTRVVAYSVFNPDDRRKEFEIRSDTTTDDQGNFVIPVAREGLAVLWIVPDDFAPVGLDLGGKRGDLGTVRLEKGLQLVGQVVDSSGAPVDGVEVTATLKDRIISQVAPPHGGNETHRAAMVVKDGRFRLGSLLAGNYRISVRKTAPHKQTEAGLAPIFPEYTVKLTEDLQSVEIRAPEHLVVQARCVDSSGQPVSGDGATLFGRAPNLNLYQTSAYADENGNMLMLAPKRLSNTRMSTFTNATGCIVRFRPFNDAKLTRFGGADEFLDLGLLEKDVKGIEIVRYRLPTLIVTAVDASNHVIADFKPEILYAATPANTSTVFASGWRTDVYFNRLSDGRWQSEKLMPNEEFVVAAIVPGFQSVQQTLKLAEGEVKEIRLTLAGLRGEKNTDGEGGKENEPKKSTDMKDGKSEGATRPDANDRTDAPKSSPLTFTGTVIERGTKKPIEGAIVRIRRVIRKPHLQDQIVQTEHKTDAQGKYQFTLGAEVQGERRLLIAPEVIHPEFIAMNAESILVSLDEERTRKDSERIVDPIEVVAGVSVSGVIETPAGQPAAGVPIQVVYWLDRAASPEGVTAWTKTQTDRDGRFKIITVRDGDAILMIEPANLAGRTVELQKKRGDLGRIRLSQGARLSGRVVDEQGNSVAGAWISPQRELPTSLSSEEIGKGGFDYTEFEVSLPNVRTDDNGRFQLLGLTPGDYWLTVADRPGNPSQSTSAPSILRGAFEPQKITVKENEQPPDIVIREVPSISVDARFLDSAGRPTRAMEGVVVGEYRGRPHLTQMRTMEGGKAVARVPKGIKDLQMHFTDYMDNRLIQYRLSADQPLRYAPPTPPHEIKLGAPDADIRDIEIVARAQPKLIISAVDSAGQPVKGINPSVEYPVGTAPRPPRYLLERKGDVRLERTSDGRWRTGELLPDTEFTLTVDAEGYQPASQKLKLAEGETKEIELRLSKK